MSTVKKLIKNYEKDSQKKRENKRKIKLKEFLRKKNKKYIKKIFSKEYLIHSSSKHSVEEKKVHQMNYDLKELYELLLNMLEKDNHPRISYEEFLIDLQEIENEGEFFGCDAPSRFDPCERHFMCIVELIEKEVNVYFDENDD
jgi:hypothetical protein